MNQHLNLSIMEYVSGRGAQINPQNQFIKHDVEDDLAFKEYLYQEGEHVHKPKTQLIRVYPKTIVNKVTSPDLGFEYSMNPYQGCEHGCVYCYARNTHEYWGYSGGIDFESKILVKANAATLLERKFDSKNWQPTPIMLSGNTDCYQPVERKLEITRNVLKVFLECRNPVGIITKNSLILRDLDLLKELAQRNLVKVAISLTSLSDKLRGKLEPRTTAVGVRLNTIRQLSEHGIPVTVMMAPIIPSINNHEIMKLSQKVAENGALGINYTIIRLNGMLPALFSDWLEKNFPDRADKVLNQIKELHGGQLNDIRFSTRMKGEGAFSKQVSQMFQVARKKYGLTGETKPYDLTLFRKPGQRQLDLF